MSEAGSGAVVVCVQPTAIVDHVCKVICAVACVFCGMHLHQAGRGCCVTPSASRIALVVGSSAAMA